MPGILVLLEGPGMVQGFGLSSTEPKPEHRAARTARQVLVLSNV